jgi:DNA-binding CsgD family transcriptional regulator
MKAKRVGEEGSVVAEDLVPDLDWPDLSAEAARAVRALKPLLDPLNHEFAKLRETISGLSEGAEAVRKTFDATLAELLTQFKRELEENDRRLAPVIAEWSKDTKPGTFWGDWYILNGKAGCSDVDREAALGRLAARIKVHVCAPGAKDRFRRFSPQERRAAYLDGVLWALDQMHVDGQTYRQAGRWFKDAAGRRRKIQPDAEFSARDEKTIIAYLRKEVRNFLEEYCLTADSEEEDKLLRLARPRGVNKSAPITAMPRSTPRTSPTSKSLEDDLIAQEERHRTWAFVREVRARLSERDLQILEMSADGLDSPEIAAKTGLKPGNVRQVKLRAVEKIDKIKKSL